MKEGISSAAGELTVMLERCKVLDTALIRLLGIYQDTSQCLERSWGDFPVA
jgi:hypothetical protein